MSAQPAQHICKFKQIFSLLVMKRWGLVPISLRSSYKVRLNKIPLHKLLHSPTLISCGGKCAARVAVFIPVHYTMTQVTDDASNIYIQSQSCSKSQHLIITFIKTLLMIRSAELCGSHGGVLLEEKHQRWAGAMEWCSSYTTHILSTVKFFLIVSR